MKKCLLCTLPQCEGAAFSAYLLAKCADASAFLHLALPWRCKYLRLWRHLQSAFTYFFSSRLQIKPEQAIFLRGKELRNDGKSNKVIATELVKELRDHCSIACHFASQAPRDTIPKEIHVSPDCLFSWVPTLRSTPLPSHQAGDWHLPRHPHSHSPSFILILKPFPPLFSLLSSSPFFWTLGIVF